jgi:excisionase family DNA binding protein
MDEFLTPHDVAKLAGVTAAAVRLWADLGRLPVTRTAGGVRLFRRVDVLLWLATRREQAKVSPRG